MVAMEVPFVVSCKNDVQWFSYCHFLLGVGGRIPFGANALCNEFCKCRNLVGMCDV